MLKNVNKVPSLVFFSFLNLHWKIDTEACLDPKLEKIQNSRDIKFVFIYRPRRLIVTFRLFHWSKSSEFFYV